jgi:predicted nucleic acid-binding protein
VISTQVLSEFFVTVVRKIPERLSLLEARERVQAFVQVWTVVDVTGLVVLEAFRGMEVYRFSYWDAQIWAAAKLNQIPVILSEDFNVGSVIEGIRFENPLADDFSIEM